MRQSRSVIRPTQSLGNHTTTSSETKRINTALLARLIIC